MFTTIRVWAKLGFAAAVALYCLLFVYNNTGQTVLFWWWVGRQHQVNSLILALTCFVAGFAAALLSKMIWRSVQQLRELRRRQRAARMEKDLAQIRAKQAARGEIPVTAGTPTGRPPL